jgi:hypothetical protein
VNQFIGGTAGTAHASATSNRESHPAPEKEKAMQLYDYGAAANARHDDDLRALYRAERCGLTHRIESSPELDLDAATHRGFFQGLRRRFANVLMSEPPLAGQSR